MDLALGHRVIRAFVEFDGIGDVLVMLVQRAVLARYGTLAGLALARDDGGIGGQDERRQRLLRLFDFGGQTAGGAALGADAFLVLFPEPGEEDQSPDGHDCGAGNDGGNDGCFGAVAFLFFIFIFLGGEVRVCFGGGEKPTKVCQRCYLVGGLRV